MFGAARTIRWELLRARLHHFVRPDGRAYRKYARGNDKPDEQKSLHKQPPGARSNITSQCLSTTRMPRFPHTKSKAKPPERTKKVKKWLTRKPRAREWRGLSSQRSLSRVAKFKELFIVTVRTGGGEQLRQFLERYGRRQRLKRAWAKAAMAA
jgi:hypothetical protein